MHHTIGNLPGCMSETDPPRVWQVARTQGKHASAIGRLPGRSVNKFLKPAPKHWSSMHPSLQIAGHHRITASSGSEPFDLVGRWLRLHRSFKAQPTAPSSERSHSTTLFAREVHSNGSQKDVVSVVNLGDVKTLASTPGQHSVKLHHQATTNFCSWHQCQ